jgi:hypothetical protein
MAIYLLEFEMLDFLLVDEVWLPDLLLLLLLTYWEGPWWLDLFVEAILEAAAILCSSEPSSSIFDIVAFPPALPFYMENCSTS